MVVVVVVVVVCVCVCEQECHVSNHTTKKITHDTKGLTDRSKLSSSLLLGVFFFLFDEPVLKDGFSDGPNSNVVAVIFVPLFIVQHSIF